MHKLKLFFVRKHTDLYETFKFEMLFPCWKKSDEVFIVLDLSASFKLWDIWKHLPVAHLLVSKTTWAWEFVHHLQNWKLLCWNLLKRIEILALFHMKEYTCWQSSHWLYNRWASLRHHRCFTMATHVMKAGAGYAVGLHRHQHLRT